jgi:hypothetical protein
MEGDNKYCHSTLLGTSTLGLIVPLYMTWDQLKLSLIVDVHIKDSYKIS